MLLVDLGKEFEFCGEGACKSLDDFHKCRALWRINQIKLIFEAFDNGYTYSVKLGKSYMVVQLSCSFHFKESPRTFVSGVDEQGQIEVIGR